MQFCNKKEITKYGVVIVTYNRKELLGECIECVKKQTRKFDSILIIDNCSTDGTRVFLDGYVKNDNEITVYHTDKNLGGAGGFKLGVQMLYSKVDYVLLIDDDAMLDKAFLESIDNNIEENIFAYSGSVLTDGIIDTSHRRILKNKVFMIKEDIEVEKYKDQSFLYDLSTFCGLLVSSDIIREIGFPKSEYFIWYDDTEYSLRINKYTKIKNINTALINHKTINSTSTDLNWKSYYGYRNSINMGKNYSRCPIVFVTYRYSYHLFRFLQYTIKARMNTDRKEYYSGCARLNLDVIVDSFKNRLGISPKYYPGFKF